MPLDGRVLLAVVAALFLALGAGIAAGSLLPGDEAVSRRQEALVRRLEEDLAGLLDRVQSLERVLARAHQEAQADAPLAQAAVKALAAGRLAGLSVALLQVGDGPDARPLLETLEAAGAEACIWATLDQRWFQGRAAAAAPPVPGSGAAREGGGRLWPEGGPAEAARALARALAGAEGGAEILSGLERRGLVRLAARPALPVQAVVLLLGRAEPDAPALFLRPFLREARAQGLAVVAAEACWTPASLLPACLAEGVPTVAHVDLASGRLCLVAAVGEGRGQYGLVAPSRPLPAWAREPVSGGGGGR
ncbi:MAG: copper transporter [Firmicutes bacterium]|nr:copper transporter [Bacillota bacterium]